MTPMIVQLSGSIYSKWYRNNFEVKRQNTQGAYLVQYGLYPLTWIYIFCNEQDIPHATYVSVYNFECLKFEWVKIKDLFSVGTKMKKNISSLCCQKVGKH